MLLKTVRPALLTLTTVVCLAAGFVSRTAQGHEVQYAVGFNSAATHYVDVEMTVPAGGKESVDLYMAVWTPGSYLVREYARHIDRVSAIDDSGQPRSIEKTSKNRWRVECRSASSVMIRYRLYCREMSVRTNWVESDFAILNGAPTFLSVDGFRRSPHVVRLDLPDRWKHSITALEPEDAKTAAPHIYRAASFDELVDSPILCGNPQVFPFEAGGVRHRLVNQGGEPVWDGDKSAQDVQKLVEEHQRMWGIVPYPHYDFLNLITESGGGLEHDNCTLMMTSRWKFREREKYLDWLGLVSHEFFHTWNVRRLRPRGLVNYDFENENYTASLWIAEGITSYYDNLALVRSGLCTRDEYLKRISKDIDRLQSSPGRHVQSLTDSSLDTWIKFYRPDENTSNSQTNYYTKGAIVAFLLDAEIRSRTGGEHSLDDVMRRMYGEFAGERGYLPQDFRDVCDEVSGSDLSGFFAVTVDGTDELSYERPLEFYGLKLDLEKPKKPKNDATESNDDLKESEGPPNDEEDKPKPWLGAEAKEQGGKLMITKVVTDSPAAQYGINVDDELIAIDGFRVSPTGLEDRLKQYQPGDSVEILISRREQIRTLPMTLGTEPEKKWFLHVREDRTDQQTARLRAWLHLPDEAPANDGTNPEAPPVDRRSSVESGSQQSRSSGASTGQVAIGTTRPRR